MTVLLHHEARADPELLAWIKSTIDGLVDLESSTIVAILGLVIFLVPAAIVLVYLFQRRRN